MIAMKCYNAERFANYMIKELGLKNSKELSEALGLDRTRISKMVRQNIISYYEIVQCLRALPGLTIQDIDRIADIEYASIKLPNQKTILGKKKLLTSKAGPFDALLS